MFEGAAAVFVWEFCGKCWEGWWNVVVAVDAGDFFDEVVLDVDVFCGSPRWDFDCFVVGFEAEFFEDFCDLFVGDLDADFGADFVEVEVDAEVFWAEIAGVGEWAFNFCCWAEFENEFSGAFDGAVGEGWVEGFFEALDGVGAEAEFC